MSVVVDTSVFIGAVLGRPGGASRQIIRSCLLRELRPVMGTSLFLEYEAVLGRPEILDRAKLAPSQLEELLDAFLSVCSWTKVYYRWRPNLRDEGDHHLLELAVAANVEVLVTKNTRDLRSGELDFPDLEILSPDELLKAQRGQKGAM